MKKIILVCCIAYLGLALAGPSFAAPAKVKGVKVNKIRSSAATVKWNEVSGAVKYVVKVRKRNGKLVATKKISAEKVLITGLKKLKKYKVSVKAKDSYGDFGKRSKFKTFKTKSRRKYHNNNFGFNIDFPKAWKKYVVSTERDYMGGQYIDFSLWSDLMQDQYLMFTVWAMDRDRYYSIYNGSSEKIGETDDWVFVYYYPMSTAVDLSERAQESDEIIDTFKLD